MCRTQYINTNAVLQVNLDKYFFNYWRWNVAVSINSLLDYNVFVEKIEYNYKLGENMILNEIHVCHSIKHATAIRFD